MTDEPKRDPLDELRDANPVSSSKIRMDSDDDVSVMRESAIAKAEGDSSLPESSQRARRSGVAVGAMVTACAIAAILLIGSGPAGPGAGEAFAGEAIEAAEANPRVLVDASGWSVTNADGFDLDSGTVLFRNDEQDLTLDWYRPPEEYAVPEGEVRGELPELDQWFRFDELLCASDDGPVECGTTFGRDTEVTVLGRNAVLSERRTVTEERTSSYFSVQLPPIGRTYLTMLLRSVPEEDVGPLLDSLVQVDVETWLSALPPKTVKPLERPEVVDEMLNDVPIHESVDAEALKSEITAGSRYNVGADVTSAVACGWLDQWAVAVDRGDEAAAQEAVDAMSTSRDWDILQEMNERGGWSKTIWEYADEMERGERNALLGSSGTESAPDGSVYELRPSYATGIGCDSEQRTLREGENSSINFPDPVPVDSPTLEAQRSASPRVGKPSHSE